MALGISKGYTTFFSQRLALYAVVSKDDAKLYEWTETTKASFLTTFKAAIHDISTVEAFESFDAEEIRSMEEHVPYVYHVISGIYAKSWDAYIAAEVELKKQDELKLFLDHLNKELATSETAMDFENDNFTQACVRDSLKAYCTAYSSFAARSRTAEEELDCGKS